MLRRSRKSRGSQNCSPALKGAKPRCQPRREALC